MESEPSTSVGPVEMPMASFGEVSSVNGHDSSVNTSFAPYPPARPFTNTDYERSPIKPLMSYPESNRDGVLSALQSLQEKMKKLEMERKEAESNLQTLATETELYKTSLQRNQFRHIESVSSVSRQHEEELDDIERDAIDTSAVGNERPQQKNLETQLSSAETRCQLLEKQLDYMRKMVHTAERDRIDAVNKVKVLQQHKEIQENPSPFTADTDAQLERIGDLERDHLRLTATQSLAESKIKELEDKLKDERNHRRQLQERALELESAAMAHKILLSTEKQTTMSSNGKTKKPAASKKKKKKVVNKKQQAPVKAEPSKHYRLNLADIPFVAGKSTAPSHAVGANVQKVLAMMKSHNLMLCSSLYNGHIGGCNGHARRSNSPRVSSPALENLDQDLGDLLAQLQDEFGQLSLEHQEFLHQIHETKDPQLQEDLERELDSLVMRMEAKGVQISKVRQHQQRMEDAMRQAKRVGKKSDYISRPSSATGRLQANHKHVHSPSASRHTHASGNVRPKSSRADRDQKQQELSPPSLNVLKDMKKLQTTLRRDDLCWE